MIKYHPFFKDFSQSMRLGDETRYHLDDLPYFLSWPLVYILKRTRVTPNQIGLLSFLTGLVFLAGLVCGLTLNNHYLLTLFLGLRILLDCIDGQLARYSDQTSSLGALYDLVADFAFAVLLFMTMAYLLISGNSVNPLLAVLICLLSFFSFIFTATVHSYLVLLGVSKNLPDSVIKNNFLDNLPNDRPDDDAYTRKLNFFNRLFKVTWRPVSLVVLSALGRGVQRQRIDFLLHVLSLSEYGMHLVILWVIVLSQSPLLYFVVFEIILFAFMIFSILLVLKRTARDE